MIPIGAHNCLGAKMLRISFFKGFCAYDYLIFPYFVRLKQGNKLMSNTYSIRQGSISGIRILGAFCSIQIF